MPLALATTLPPAPPAPTGFRPAPPAGTGLPPAPPSSTNLHSPVPRPRAAVVPAQLRFCQACLLPVPVTLPPGYGCCPIPARVLHGYVRRFASRLRRRDGVAAPSLVHAEPSRWVHRVRCGKSVQGLDPCLSESGLNVLGRQRAL